MTPPRKSCVVAFPKECNYATFPSVNATGCATVPQPSNLKALAAKVLTRNQQCNRDATSTKHQCNFSPEDHNTRLHGFTTCNQDATTRPAIPLWCRSGCPGLEVIYLPGEGDVAGCVPPLSGSWRRLDHLQECPAMEKPPGPVVPSWCNAGCEHFHRLTVPDLGTLLWCCWETDSTCWRRVRVETMNKCPLRGEL